MGFTSMFVLCLAFSANGEIEKVRKSSEGELARLQMALKKSDLQNQCSEQTIEQKVRFFAHETSFQDRSLKVIFHRVSELKK